MTYRGFTLIEMLAVIAILGFVGLALTSAITYFYKSNRQVMASMALANAARTAGNDFVTNARSATYGDDGSYPIIEASTSTITFFSNTDSDASIEKIHWYLSNGTLYRAVTQYSGTTYDNQPEKVDALFPSIENDGSVPLFQYFDAQGTQLSDPVSLTDIRSLKMNVSVGTTTASSSTFSLSSFATFRNLIQ